MSDRYGVTAGQMPRTPYRGCELLSSPVPVHLLITSALKLDDVAGSEHD